MYCVSEISEKFDKTDAAEDTFDDLGRRKEFIPLSMTDRSSDHTSAETVSKHEDVAGVDESDANFVAMLQDEADNNGTFNIHLYVDVTRLIPYDPQMLPQKPRRLDYTMATSKNLNTQSWKMTIGTAS